MASSDNHPIKRSDSKLHERQLRERRARNYEEELKIKERTIQRRKEIWLGLSKYIHDHGGFLVSAENEKHLRIEIPKNSSLPVKLVELGYHPRMCATGTRIQNGKFLPTDTIEIVLGSDR